MLSVGVGRVDDRGTKYFLAERLVHVSWKKERERTKQGWCNTFFMRCAARCDVPKNVPKENASLKDVFKSI